MQLDLASDYFELFGMTPSFYIKQTELDDKHSTLQSMLHPDRHINTSDQQRRIAAQGSALTNEAYRTLSDSCLRAAYLLELKGVVLDSENETTKDTVFLMEQMTLRESLQDSQGDVQALNTLQQLASEKMTVAMDEFDQAYTAVNTESALAAIGKMRFIDKLKREIEASVRQLRIQTLSGQTLAE